MKFLCEDASKHFYNSAIVDGSGDDDDDDAVELQPMTQQQHFSKRSVKTAPFSSVFSQVNTKWVNTWINSGFEDTGSADGRR